MATEARGLGRELLAAWAGDGAGADAERVGALVAAHLAQGRATWPDVDVDDLAYARFVGERLAADADPVAVLPDLRAEDLVLVCGCTHGCEAAAQRFRTYVTPAVRHAANRAAVDSIDDLIHRVYDRLFLPDGDNPPRIRHYLGKGDLRRWVSVVATRLAIDGRRQSKGGDRLRTLAFDRLLAETQDIELDYLRGVYRREFKEAFAAAIESLDERQRNVLRYQVEGLTADQVGRLYNVHRVTVARWLSKIRSTLFERTREQLGRRLNLEGSEADSILRLVRGPGLGQPRPPARATRKLSVLQPASGAVSRVEGHDAT